MGTTEDSEDDALLRAVASAPARPPPGEKVGSFELVEVLGKGGMGIVYRARDHRLDRDVALKMIAASTDDDGRERKRLLREAKSAAAVSHPNVATVYEVGEHEGRVFIAMELVSGKSLRSLLADGPLDVVRATSIARDISRGLAKAHDKGIVHRDLKPENVIVGEQTKVLDFGLARAANATQASAEIAGTPGYMSPEQLRGEATDARTDVFAFGVLLHEMLTGSRPPARGTRKIPTRLERLIDRCLADSPSDRPANAAALVESLDADPSERSRPLIAIGIALVLAVAAYVAIRPSQPIVRADPSPASASASSSASAAASASASASALTPDPLPPQPAQSTSKSFVRPAAVPSTSASTRRRDPLGDQF